MEDLERPRQDAGAAEIREWMDESFAQSVIEGMESVYNEDETIEIIDYERDEVVGTIDTDGNLKTESEALRSVSEEYIDQGVPVLVPIVIENENGEIEHADAEKVVKPGMEGFVRAYVDALPSPFDCDPEVVNELPVPDGET